jgi:hypothetical protein
MIVIEHVLATIGAISVIVIVVFLVLMIYGLKFKPESKDDDSS